MNSSKFVSAVEIGISFNANYELQKRVSATYALPLPLALAVRSNCNAVSGNSRISPTAGKFPRRRPKGFSPSGSITFHPFCHGGRLLDLHYKPPCVRRLV